MVELSELSGGKGDFFKHIENVACTWDGSRRFMSDPHSGCDKPCLSLLSFSA